MGLVYFLSIMPIGLIMRAFGRNPLSRKTHGDGYWVQRAPEERRSDLERQF
jgi:hypothetical protein